MCPCPFFSLSHPSQSRITDPQASALGTQLRSTMALPLNDYHRLWMQGSYYRNYITQPPDVCLEKKLYVWCWEREKKIQQVGGKPQVQYFSKSGCNHIKSSGMLVKGSHSWAPSRCIKLKLGHGKNWTFNTLCTPSFNTYMRPNTEDSKKRIKRLKDTLSVTSILILVLTKQSNGESNKIKANFPIYLFLDV